MTYIYSIATGEVKPLKKASRKAVDFIKDLDGFYGVHPAGGRAIWFFGSLNEAKRAKNQMAAEGIITGRNICKFEVSTDGVPDFVEVCE